MEPFDVEPHVKRLLEGLRFGSVEIQVHDGRVVQIERRERFRPPPSSHPTPGGTDTPSFAPFERSTAGRSTGDTP